MKIKNITYILPVIVLAVLLVTGVALDSQVSAQAAEEQVCAAIGGCDDGGTQVSDVIKTVINIMSAVGGIIAVIMIIIGGIKYTTSNGDSNSAASAKNTIIYALVGLVVVAFAQVIVQFVLQRT